MAEIINFENFKQGKYRKKKRMTIEDCIKEFYNIVGHTTFDKNAPGPGKVEMTEFGPLYERQKSAVTVAKSSQLLTKEDYTRVKRVLEYYKKYSTLTRQSGFADYKVQEDNYSRSR